MAEVSKIPLNDFSLLESNLLSTLDEAAFFSELAHYFSKSLPLDCVTVVQVNFQGETKFRGSNGLEVIGSEDFISLQLVKHVVKSRNSYYCNNIQNDPLFKSIQQNYPYQSEICFPIRYKTHVMGALIIQRKVAGEKFTENFVKNTEQILQQLERPFANMHMYLSVKNLNEALLNQVKIKEEEIYNEKVEGKNLGEQKDLAALAEEIMLIYSDNFKKSYSLAQKLALTHNHVLISGESGVGKTHLARNMHYWSHRSTKPIVIVNCVAKSEKILEEELFGIVTHHVSEYIVRPGAFASAHRGTLILKNLGQLGPKLQMKLLHFLLSGDICPVGGDRLEKVDVRLITTAQNDLFQIAMQGNFCKDLFLRLHTMHISLPSAQEIQGQLELFCHHFLKTRKSSVAKQVKIISPQALKYINRYPWKGNIRELFVALEYACLSAEGITMEHEHLPDFLQQTQREENKVDLGPFQIMSLCDLEKRHISLTLTYAKGNKTKAAKHLGITVKTLYNKLHSYGMIEKSAMI